MVLPPGINKATGPKAALADLELSPHNVVGIGDAENDFAFLKSCGCSAAVSNAVPALKKIENCGHRGRRMVGPGRRRIGRANPGRRCCHHPNRARHGIRVGKRRSGEEMLLVPFAGSALISGNSGIGKSTLATALTERMAEKKFEFCVFDPEGDYEELDQAIPVGSVANPPAWDWRTSAWHRRSSRFCARMQAAANAALSFRP
jgi:hypothetical protein